MTMAVIGLAAGVRRILIEKPWGSFGGWVVQRGIVEILRWGDVEIVVVGLGAERVPEWCFRPAAGVLDRT